MKVKTASFKSGRYRVYTDEGLDGLTVMPDDPTDHPVRYIWINPRLRGKAKLETIIHEALHAAEPKASEATVERAARDVARLLWRLGYRENGDG